MLNEYSVQPKIASLCANLCDITSSPLENGNDLFRLCQLTDTQASYPRNSSQTTSEIKRIYVGSYFCDQFFLSFSDAFFEHVADFCRACELPATLVVPIFAQSTLKRGITRIENIFTTHPYLFDEITVNDYGMAMHLAEFCLEHNIVMNWGRLFMKEPRDPRHAEASQGYRRCAIDAETVAYLKAQFPLGVVELDPFAPMIDMTPLADAAPFALHLPHCFMSTGHICEAASAELDPQHSFRANATCTRQCCRSFTISISEGISTEQTCYLIKNGRTVFFENPGCDIVAGQTPARILYSPETFAFSLPEDENYSWQVQGGYLWV